MLASDYLNKINPDKIYKKLKTLETENGMPIEFKNRICMSEYFEIKYSTGNTRIAEDKYLSSIFCSHKEKHKIIITEIYDDYNNRLNNPSNGVKYKEVYEFTSKYQNGLGIYGIYADDNLIYIGSSSSLDKRIRDHCYQMYLEDGYNDSKYIELHKYITEGKSISFKIIDNNITEENRYEMEYQYIEKYKPILNSIGVDTNIPYIATLPLEVKKYNGKQIKNIKLINQYKVQIEKYHNKIKELQEKIDALEKEITN